MGLSSGFKTRDEFLCLGRYVAVAHCVDRTVQSRLCAAPKGGSVRSVDPEKMRAVASPQLHFTWTVNDGVVVK